MRRASRSEGFPSAELWARNKKLDVTSCTIITGPATEPMRQLHDRQPTILDEAAYDEIARSGDAGG